MGGNFVTVITTTLNSIHYSVLVMEWRILNDLLFNEVLREMETTQMDIRI